MRHIHVGFELMLYILEGRVRHEYGPGLKNSIENEAGDFIYIEPGVPHEVFNLSGPYSQLTLGLRWQVVWPILNAFGRIADCLLRMESHHARPRTF